MKKRIFLSAVMVFAAMFVFTLSGCGGDGGSGNSGGSGKYKKFHGGKISEESFTSYFGFPPPAVGTGQIISFNVSDWNSICNTFRMDAQTGTSSQYGWKGWPHSGVVSDLNIQRDQGWLTQAEVDQILSYLESNGKVLFVKRPEGFMGLLWVFDMYAKE